MGASECPIPEPAWGLRDDDRLEQEFQQLSPHASVCDTTLCPIHRYDDMSHTHANESSS